MTNNEAIRKLKDISDEIVRYGDFEYNDETERGRIEALEMAINALEHKRQILDALDKSRRVEVLAHGRKFMITEMAQ